MPPPGRAGFLARRAGGPWTVLGQILPKARRRPPCSMLATRPRPRLQLRCRRAPSAPRPARRRPASRGAGTTAMAGAARPPSLLGGAETSRHLPGPRRRLPRPRNPAPRLWSLGGPRGCPGGKLEDRRCLPAPPPRPPAPPAARCRAHPRGSLPGSAGVSLAAGLAFIMVFVKSL